MVRQNGYVSAGTPAWLKKEAIAGIIMADVMEQIVAKIAVLVDRT
jgi:hypothetical protein